MFQQNQHIHETLWQNVSMHQHSQEQDEHFTVILHPVDLFREVHIRYHTGSKLF